MKKNYYLKIQYCKKKKILLATLVLVFSFPVWASDLPDPAIILLDCGICLYSPRVTWTGKSSIIENIYNL
jgi:hypothetical protein